MHDDGAGGVCPFSGAPAPGRRGVSRRSVLGAALGGLALAPALSGTAHAAPAKSTRSAPTTTPAPGPTALPSVAPRGAHGVGDPRGIDIAVTKGRTAEARFGVMFKNLPAFRPDDDLLVELADAMNDRKAPLPDVSMSDLAFDNPYIPAGFTYWGQFVDHDMTHDTTDLTAQSYDPSGTVNFDTPRFDLDSVYGKGPAGSPELYEADGRTMRLTFHDDLFDLPRDGKGNAFLGDPRNDENLIVAQLQVAFLRLHNTFIARGKTFAQAQSLCRWHYQWLIVHDYLPRICGADRVSSLLTVGRNKITVNNKFYKPRDSSKPYMPIEYAGAAYRFGHSMIRAEYEMQDGHTVPIFADGPEDLRGSRPIPADMWIDWNYFFDIPGMHTPDDRNMARLIDTQVAMPLASLPPTVVARTQDAITALARRNLLRGKRVGLPSGQDVARAMGVAPLANDRLGLSDPRWGGKAPLWFYVLKEAELLEGGRNLGPVGGRIVAEVILGILAADPTSYFNAKPTFTPGSSFRIGDLLLMAGAVDARALVPQPTGAVDPAAAPGAPGVVEVPDVGTAATDPVDPAATSPVGSATLTA